MAACLKLTVRMRGRFHSESTVMTISKVSYKMSEVSSKLESKTMKESQSGVMRLAESRVARRVRNALQVEIPEAVEGITQR